MEHRKGDFFLLLCVNKNIPIMELFVLDLIARHLNIYKFYGQISLKHILQGRCAHYKAILGPCENRLKYASTLKSNRFHMSVKSLTRPKILAFEIF